MANTLKLISAIEAFDIITLRTTKEEVLYLISFNFNKLVSTSDSFNIELDLNQIPEFVTLNEEHARDIAEIFRIDIKNAGYLCTDNHRGEYNYLIEVPPIVVEDDLPF